MGLHPVRLDLGLSKQEDGSMPICAECCTADAVIEDLDVDPPRPWCLGCATALVAAGDPVINYRSLTASAAEYSRTLTARSTATLPFG
ncbi:hypothetical protein [Kitasatospora sp. NPDC058184]|uniref:hypothetical protein n=1 Tax=unclassified Kitasatospora TaxID=2633591 RepID=UPI0036DE7986